ncbi:hypothetical protein [Pontiella sulfatireligans]|uniref:Protein BatD n=1 Tax=Pontiella sulfatireligans TaxID=2750658 RepID=A0A6C2UQ03_9BACT|nr:hypothetical protein [Pontiella sulfatireligans]VGO22372.1 hypothetical protein SCARR_04455 [Pontiella sulfatireligans]
MMRWVSGLKVEGRKSFLLFSCFLSLFVAIPFLSGCSPEKAETAGASEPALSRQYRKGSATVIVSASETNIPTSGKIHLMIDVHAPPNAAVVFPEIEYFIEPFSVVDGYAEPVQILPNGKHLHRRAWVLVPNLPGESIFQPLEIQVGTASVATEPIAVQVTSLLPAGIEAFEIKDIAGPAELLPEQEKQQRLGLILLGFAVIATFLTLLINLIHRPKVEIVLAPHEAAFQALENLPEDELDRIQTLTEILLAFIGGRYRIPTAGKTINEILPHLPKPQLLGRREPLEGFLTTGEQIRFSNKVPDGFADELENYVRSFVDAVKEVPCD